MSLWQSKFRAFFIHLVLSAIVISLFLLMVTERWYPGLLFQLENVWEGLRILIPVDAILGPILTLLLFVPGKKGLKFDLGIIAMVQLGALIYGGITIYGQRPAILAFVGDRVEVIAASEPFVADIPMGRFGADEVSAPLFTYVMPPESAKVRSDYIVSGVSYAKTGKRHYPVRDYLDKISEKALDPHKIIPSNENSKAALADFMKRKEEELRNDLLLLRLEGTTFDTVIVVIDTRTGKIIHMLDINPWTEYDNS